MIGFFSRLGQVLAWTASALASSVAGVASGLVQGWDRFWFAPADPFLLGVLRLGTGSVLLWMLLVSGPLLPSLYGPQAWVDQETANAFRHEQPFVPPNPDWRTQEELAEQQVPPPVYRPHVGHTPKTQAYYERWGWWPGFVHSQGNAQFSPYFHLRTPLGMHAFHALALLVAVLYVLGIGTRATGVLAWIVALCYIHRVQAALFGMDTILAVLLLYLAIGPSGACLSLDRRWGWADDQRSVSANVALRLMQVHFCFIYLASGCSKLQGVPWWNGTALWQTLANYEFTPRVEAYTAFLRWLAHDRLLWESFNWIAGSLFTLGLEIGVPFLIWRRDWRWLCVLGASLLHAGIGMTMGLTSFSVLMVLLLGSFIPAEELRKRLGFKSMNAA